MQSVISGTYVFQLFDSKLVLGQDRAHYSLQRIASLRRNSVCTVNYHGHPVQ